MVDPRVLLETPRLLRLGLGAGRRGQFRRRFEINRCVMNFERLDLGAG